MKQLTEAQLRTLLVLAYNRGYNYAAMTSPTEIDSAESFAAATATDEGRCFVRKRNEEIDLVMRRC